MVNIMTTEEKAIAYDKAIEKIKYVMEHGVSPVLTKEDLQDIFPELAESEDERIRKAQLDYRRSVGGKEWHGVPVQETIAWLEKQCKQDDYDDNIITRDDEILQAISVGLTDVAKDAGWSDFGGIPIEDIMDWLEKQIWKKEYTFKSIPRLLDMIEPTESAKAYCQKLIDTLINEGYAADAKIVCECLRKMCGEKVALATMDEKHEKTALEHPKGGELLYVLNKGYKQGYKDAIEKARKWLFEYNKRQAERFGAKSIMRLSDYTINVGDFRKAMEEQQ